MVARGKLDGAVQPGKIEPAFLRLDKCPGELAHVHKLKTHFFDVREVALPLLVGPMFWIIIDADCHQVFWWEEARRRLSGRHRWRHM